MSASVGNNGIQASIGYSQGESDYQKIFYTNSQLNAKNGSIMLTSNNNTNIIGANLIAKDMILNIGNNLNIKSKQTEEYSTSSGFGFNVGGGGVGASGASVNWVLM